MYEDSAIHRETRTKLALLLLLLVECLLSPKLTRREEGIFSPTDCFVAVGVSVILVSRVIKFPIGPINFAKLKSNYRARGIPARFERIRDKGPRREGESFHPYDLGGVRGTESKEFLFRACGGAKLTHENGS